MKYVIHGKTGRAQLVVHDFTGEDVPLRKRKDHVEFAVYLLPRSANPNTSYTAAGDQAYYGPDLDRALLQIRAWTGLDEVRLPREVAKYLNESTAPGRAA